MPYTYADLAFSTAASPRLSGGGTLTVATGDGPKFKTPTSQKPMRIAVYRGDALVTVLRATGRSGDVLTISGASATYSDADVEVDDKLANVLVADDFDEIQAAIDDLYGGMVEDSTVVHLTGAEAVTGRKTLTSPIAKGDGTNPVATFQNSSAAVVSSFDASGYGFVEKATFVLAFGENLTTGTNKTQMGVIASAAGKITKCKVKAETNGGSGGFGFTIKKNGSAIFSGTQSVAVSTTTVQSFNTFSVTTVAEGDVFTVDVVSAGTGVQFVNVTLYYIVGNA